ncbi:RNA-binding protein 39 [Linum perenne]
MDFDEYEYLEKTVENPEPEITKETANGSESKKSGERNHSRGSKHKSDEREEEDDEHRRSKRSKSRDDTRDHDRHRERDGERDRHRSSREVRDKEKGRDGEERNGKDRERERERDRDRDRRERDREREKDKDGERERSRRSGSRSEREKSKDRVPREREFKERDMHTRYARAIFRWSSWHLGQAQELRAWVRKKEDGAEPEADPERDQRTVFAYQICLKADERDVYEFFSRAGKVRDVRLIMDRNSRRSKGVGYIEFYDVMSVPMAIALSGQPLRGVPVMVKPSEAEKNLVQSTATASVGPGGAVNPYSGGARRLYVGNLHFNITEDQLRQVFEPFGTVELVQLPVDETGHCKGFGFIQFARLEDAKNALNLNGQVEIAGRPIKVSSVTDQTGQDGGTNAADFDDDEGGGLALNARSRVMLMQKLDRSGTSSRFCFIKFSVCLLSCRMVLLTWVCANTPPPLLPGAVVPQSVASLLPPGLPGAAIPTLETIGVPSECLLLKNMFDPQTETEPDFDQDIKDDVEEECSKFGTLRHIFVDKNSMGLVYLRFENTQAALGAQRSLHGRWFAGKMITATFMVPQMYEQKFPESR